MKLIRKTIIGVSTVAFTAIALTASTYAWFKINSTAKVNGMDLSVHGGEGFRVSIDGSTYSSSLTKKQIQAAMLVKYDPNNFILHTNEEGVCELYSTKYVEAKDDSGNTIYEVDEQGNPTSTPKMVYTYDQVATESQIASALKKIELMPLTSKNGINLTDLYNAPATSQSGRYVEFDVYLKTVNESYYVLDTTFRENEQYYKLENGEYIPYEDGVIDKTTFEHNTCYRFISAGKYATPTSYQDNIHYYSKQGDTYLLVDSATVNKDNYKNYYIYDGFKYDIYLNGETTEKDGGGKEHQIPQTKLVSEATEEKLGANITYVKFGDADPVKTLTRDKTITLYSSNAMRISIEDVTHASGANIYELNDYVNGSSNYGSYATKYSDKASAPSGYDLDLDYQYGYQYNAMYTYYSNLKKATNLKSSPLYSKLMDYDDKPTTITDLTTKDSNGNYTKNKKITTLLSGDEKGTQVTFRIWLEGWDADCFDGLNKSVATTISLTAKRIY